MPKAKKHTKIQKMPNITIQNTLNFKMTDPKSIKYRYSVSGSAAHTRLLPLMPKEWEDCSPDFCRHRGTTTTTNTTTTITTTASSSIGAPANNTNASIPNADISPSPPPPPPHFVWENAPRKDSKVYRDSLKAYSHLPNGTNILDSKWVLARLLVQEGFQEQGEKTTCTNSTGSTGRNKYPLLVALESHCFRGPEGYADFCRRVFAADGEEDDNDNDNANANANHSANPNDSNTVAPTAPSFPDLLKNNGQCPDILPPPPSSLWVIKDAFSNGAGGIWVVDQTSAHTLDSSSSSNNNGPLYQDHRYVAQRYTWPPVLYGGRKCHVRVYGLITADGRAFVHQRAFLHVANDTFSYHATSNNCGQDSIHITNCCANSHDDTKFAGEILADLEATDFAVDETTGQTIVPLAPFFTSIKSSLAALAERAMPFLEGGQRNNGFEYLGMDFILSYKNFKNSTIPQPVAYLLEVNAPPSQDTATGLKHAEDLHDTVIRDILALWVFPKVTDGVYVENPGGWRQANEAAPTHEQNKKEKEAEKHILPSKAAIINKIRWGMVERKATKTFASDITNEKQREGNSTSRYVTLQYQQEDTPSETNPAVVVSAFARTKFPFFQRITDTDSVACRVTEETRSNGRRNGRSQEDECRIFWENAGGSQVPNSVIHAMNESLSYRNRAIIGKQAKEGARNVLGKILNAPPEDFSLFLGANASSLLMSLANQYIQLGLVKAGDEIVLSSENHLANVSPWQMVSAVVGATVKWWAPTRNSYQRVEGESADEVCCTQLENILTPKTRIVAITHASNVLGQVRDLRSIRALLDKQTGCRAHLVVDGVAAAPHCYPELSSHLADWYVVSLHKLFGPHIGVLSGRKRTVVQEACCAADVDINSTDSVYKLLETGTINYEGCSGVIGLSYYLSDLATAPLGQKAVSNHRSNTKGISQSPYQSPGEAVCVADLSKRNELTHEVVAEAFRRIRLAEDQLQKALLNSLRKSDNVRVLEIDKRHLDCVVRLPVVSFVHKTVPATTIVEICAKNGIVCRHGTFLTNPHLLKDFGVLSSAGVVRMSLAHYNTCEEIETVESVLHSIPGW